MSEKDDFLQLAKSTLEPGKKTNNLAVSALAQFLADDLGHHLAARLLCLSLDHADLCFNLPTQLRRGLMAHVGGFYQGSMFPADITAINRGKEDPVYAAMGACRFLPGDGWPASKVGQIANSRQYRPRHLLIDDSRFDDPALLALEGTTFSQIKTLSVQNSLIWLHRPFSKFPVFSGMDSLEFVAGALNFGGLEQIIHKPLYRQLDSFHLFRGYLFAKPFASAIRRSSAMRGLNSLDLDISGFDENDMEIMSGCPCLPGLRHFGITLARDAMGEALEPLARRLELARSITVRCQSGCSGVVKTLFDCGVMGKIETLKLASATLSTDEVEILAERVTQGALSSLSLNDCVFANKNWAPLQKALPALRRFDFSSPMGQDQTGLVKDFSKTGSDSIERMSLPDLESPENLFRFPRLRRLDVASVKNRRGLRDKARHCGIEILNDRPIAV